MEKCTGGTGEEKNENLMPKFVFFFPEMKFVSNTTIYVWMQEAIEKYKHTSDPGFGEKARRHPHLW